MSDQGPPSEDLSGILILGNNCFNFIFFPLTKRTKIYGSWHHPIKNHNEDLLGDMSSLLLFLCAVGVCKRFSRASQQNIQWRFARGISVSKHEKFPILQIFGPPR